MSVSDFLRNVDGERLIEAVFDSAEVLHAKTEVTGGTPFGLLLKDVFRSNPGIEDLYFVIESAYKEDGASDEFRAGILAGMVHLTQALRKVAEIDEITPPSP